MITLDVWCKDGTRFNSWWANLLNRADDLFFANPDNYQVTEIRQTILADYYATANVYAGTVTFVSEEDMVAFLLKWS